MGEYAPTKQSTTSSAAAALVTLPARFEITQS
jgi:hypothetical protein